MNACCCADPPYGYKQNFRPPPEQGARVYAFNPATGAVAVLAEDFAMCNGLAFSPDFKTLYVTDTGEESVSKRKAAARVTCSTALVMLQMLP
jgi:sugar lactone lactonase YvrE